MLKFFFWFLLVANGLLFAYHQGHLSGLMSDGREPGRAAWQHNADKVKVLPAPGANVPLTLAMTVVTSSGTTTTAATGGAPPATDKKAPVAACTEVGNFNAAETRRFESLLAELAIADRVVKREIQEVITHMVLIPPLGGKDAAEKKGGELRKLGVTDFYIIQDSSDQRWGISLGIFKSEEAARSHLASLSQKGVRSARLMPYQLTLNKTAFQVRDLDVSAKGNLETIKADFPRLEVRSCA